MGNNREKSNIAIAILEKWPFIKGKKIISHFMVAIIFSSTVDYSVSVIKFINLPR